MLTDRRLVLATALAAFAAVLSLGSTSHGLVLCKRKSGAIKLRDACKSAETAVSTAVLNEALVCPPDSVRSGSTCIDKYEATTWDIAPSETVLIGNVRDGTVTLADLTAAGATRHGDAVDDYDPSCPDTSAGCSDLYAVSVAGVLPSVRMSWFQATAACRNAGKLLATNQEWQAAAFGTPDPGATPGAQDCNTNSAAPAATGARSNCISNVGAFDMVGNVWEWVADWIQGDTNPWNPSGGLGPGLGNAGATYGDDMLLGINPAGSQGPGGQGFPVALVRGGNFDHREAAGVFATFGNGGPDSSGGTIGFRCARRL